MTHGPPRIETARLVLRTPQVGDADGVFAYASDPEVARFMSWLRHRSLADTATFLDFAASAWRHWPAGPYMLLTREGGRLIGCSGFAFESPRVASTGYVLARDCWGNGYATEALAAMVAVAPALGLERLYALCHVEHRASAHVLEKCGFALEGLLARHTVFPNLCPRERSDVLSYARRFDC